MLDYIKKNGFCWYFVLLDIVHHWTDHLTSKEGVVMSFTWVRTKWNNFCFWHEKSVFLLQMLPNNLVAKYFHWQHKFCATFSASVNINYRLPIKVYYRICTLTHNRIEINLQYMYKVCLRIVVSNTYCVVFFVLFLTWKICISSSNVTKQSCCKM
jgi:hypothetical protein